METQTPVGRTPISNERGGKPQNIRGARSPFSPWASACCLEGRFEDGLPPHSRSDYPTALAITGWSRRPRRSSVILALCTKTDGVAKDFVQAVKNPAGRSCRRHTSIRDWPVRSLCLERQRADTNYLCCFPISAFTQKRPTLRLRRSPNPCGRARDEGRVHGGLEVPRPARHDAQKKTAHASRGLGNREPDRPV